MLYIFPGAASYAGDGWGACFFLEPPNKNADRLNGKELGMNKEENEHAGRFLTCVREMVRSAAMKSHAFCIILTYF